MHVRVVLRPLIGDLSIHFTQCRRGCKRKTKGPEWEGLDGRTRWYKQKHFLFVCVPKGTSAAGRREETSHGRSDPVTLATSGPGQTRHRLEVSSVLFICDPMECLVKPKERLKQWVNEDVQFIGC